MRLAKEHFMNSLNPFVPSVSLIKVPTRDQREWVRKAVFWALAAQFLFLMALLLQQGRSETASPEASLASVNLASAQASVPAAAAPPEAAHSNPATPVSSEVVMPMPPAPTRELYAIRSGDTLYSIARNCGCTVKALKSLNGLANERLVVGQKLKLPDGRMQIAAVTRPL
jgi:hypothetical protein